VDLHKSLLTRDRRSGPPRAPHVDEGGHTIKAGILTLNPSGKKGKAGFEGCVMGHYRANHSFPPPSFWCRHLCFFNLTIVNQERTPERRGGDQSVVVGPKAFAGIVEITWDDLGQLRNQDPH